MIHSVPKIHISIFWSGLIGIACMPTAALALGGQSHLSGHSVSSAKEGHLGLGAMLGAPTGLSAKYRYSGSGALDFGLAFSFNNYLEFYTDYLYHFPGAFGNGSESSWEFTPYVGIGAVLFGNTVGNGSTSSRYFGSNSSNIGLGVRIPLGIEWLPSRVPLGVFGELVPGVGMIPGTFAFVDGDVGVRYYF